MEFVIVEEQVAQCDSWYVVWKAKSGGDALRTGVGGFGEVDDAEVGICG